MGLSLRYLLECKTECSICASLDVCQTCEPSFVFYDSKCPDKCPIGTFDLNAKCESKKIL